MNTYVWRRGCLTLHRQTANPVLIPKLHFMRTRTHKALFPYLALSKLQASLGHHLPYPYPPSGELPHLVELVKSLIDEN